MVFDHGSPAVRACIGGSSLKSERFARSAICKRTFTFFSCSICAFAVLLVMAMNGELVDVLQCFAKGEARNPAFCDRAQKILE
jgi:hypothetical protein